MTTILLVEDDLPLMRLYEGSLQDSYNVTAVASGTEAMNILQTDFIDLIVLDLNLPDKHGTDILDYIVSEPRLDHLLAIVITGFQTYRKDKLPDCVIEVLSKPVTASILTRSVQKALDQFARS